jgi:hypothetical protein
LKKTTRRTSASPTRSRPFKGRKLARALVAFAELAERERIRWYLFGAQAVAAYGVVRATHDIDITIDAGRRSIASLKAALASAGFAPKLPSDAAFERDTRVLPVVHEATGWSLDLVLAGPGLEQQFIADATLFHASGHDIPVVAAAHLVALKILAGRPKDLEDVRSLLALGIVDDAEVRVTLGVLEEALDQADLVPVYERLRAESRPRRRER